MKLLSTLLLALSASATQLWFGPYVQDLSPHRAIVQWVTTGGSGLGELRLLPAGPTVLSTVETVLPSITFLSVPIYIHRAELNQLEPGKTYRYEVKLDGLPLAPASELSFQTPGDGPFTFLVIGDSGDGGTPQRELASRLAREPAHFLLHVGDIAYWEGNFQQFAELFFFIYPGLLHRMAVFPVPGNHDYEFRDALAYRTLFSVPSSSVDPAGLGRYYSFDWGPAHFTILDTNRSLHAALHGSGNMLRWLENDLASTRKPFRIVALHHPPFPTSQEKLHDPTCALVARYLTPILERHGVQLVLAGHEHVYQRTKARRDSEFLPGLAGTVYVTTGGGGSQLYPPGPASFVAFNAPGSHYLRITVNAQTLSLEAINPQGERKDSLTLSSAPLLLDSPVLNAASFTPALAPGGLASVFGWNLALNEAAATGPALPLSLGGASATIAGKPAPLLYASRNQLNLLLPPDLAHPSPLTVKTPHGEITHSLSSSPHAPALFTLAPDFPHLAAALHADGTPVTPARPAMPGEWLSLFATGFGAVTNTPAYGQPAPAQPLSWLLSPLVLHVGGARATVQFSGLAPGFWGLYQVNFQVPPVSGRLPLSLSVGGIPGNTLELPVR